MVAQVVRCLARPEPRVLQPHLTLNERGLGLIDSACTIFAAGPVIIVLPVQISKAERHKLSDTQDFLENGYFKMEVL